MLFSKLIVLNLLVFPRVFLRVFFYMRVSRLYSRVICTQYSGFTRKVGNFGHFS